MSTSMMKMLSAYLKILAGLWMEIIEWKFINIYYRPNQEQLRKMQVYVL
jgi:hypothetical protein